MRAIPIEMYTLLGGFESSRRALNPTEYDRVRQYLVSVD